MHSTGGFSVGTNSVKDFYIPTLLFIRYFVETKPNNKSRLQFLELGRQLNISLNSGWGTC